jgi:argininosuccinate lyase
MEGGVMALWGARFSSSPAEAVFNLSRSVDFDWRLAPYDLVSSLAHLRALGRAGVVTEEISKQLEEGIRSLLSDVIAGRFTPSDEDEDVHSALERALLERLGTVGGSLRAGRSRNDQVVTDLKLYLLDTLTDLALLIDDLAAALLTQGEKYVEVVAPGFTHLQHAQPISFGQELAKHAFALERDLDRLADWRRRAMLSPLGSAALAGSPLVLDPEESARHLGFDGTVDNSIDAVSDRDFVAEALFVLALLGTHISRIGEEFTLFASSEFGWVKVDDAYSTGSSIMPQKRNPDVAELARGKSGRLLGNLVAVMTVLKGLPFAYNRDLQEDKEPIFDSIDTLSLLLPAVTGMITTAKFQIERISDGAIAGFALATEVADYLVRKGMPFAEAHEVTGQAVRLAESRSVGLESLSLDDFSSVHPLFGADLIPLLSAEGAVRSRTSVMGTSPASVSAAISRVRGRLALQRSQLGKWRKQMDEVLGQ